MRHIQKRPSKLKELLCVVFGHDWTEHGARTCVKHSVMLDEYNICGRCGLENHIRQTCQQCLGKIGLTRGDVE